MRHLTIQLSKTAISNSASTLLLKFLQNKIDVHVYVNFIAILFVLFNNTGKLMYLEHRYLEYHASLEVR